MPAVSGIVSKSAFVPEHPDALARYCSDGRFTRAVEELLAQLGHDRLDVLRLPGGPALLDLTSTRVAMAEVVREAASFLITSHAIRIVVLMSHDGCGYYRARFPLESPESMRRRQTTDLVAAARWLANTHPGLAVSMFHAETGEHTRGRVRFLPITGSGERAR